jgi:thiol-disulfide isomerase/thioredoxin
MKSISKIGLIIFIGLISCKEKQQQKPNAENQSGEGLSKVKIANLNGQAIDLSSYKGKTIFINFWATWCKPCLQEMPSIKSAMEFLNNKDIVFLFASDETTEQIENFKNKNEYNFNYVKAENMEELGIMALPTTYIFDKNGNLVFNEMGYRKWDGKENIDLILNFIK